MEQMNMRDTFKLVLPSDLSPKNKVEFLESIMLLKEKRDRKTKGRNCTDEKKKDNSQAKNNYQYQQNNYNQRLSHL